MFTPDAAAAAFGPPRVAGNPVRIYELATDLLGIYSELTEGAERIRGIACSDRFQRIIALTASLFDQPRADIREFIYEVGQETERGAQYLATNPHGPHMTITIALTLKVDVDLSAEIKRELADLRGPMAAAQRLWSRIPIEGTDLMDGVAFERRLAAMFRDLGNEVDLTPPTGDYGADLVVRHPSGDSFVVQAKCQAQPVGLGAVQEIIGARVHYRISRALVITNSTFTSSAEVLALSAGVELWNRARLAIEFQRAAEVSGFEHHPVVPEVPPGRWSAAAADNSAPDVARMAAEIQAILMTRPALWEYLLYSKVLLFGLASMDSNQGPTAALASA